MTYFMWHRNTKRIGIILGSQTNWKENRQSSECYHLDEIILKINKRKKDLIQKINYTRMRRTTQTTSLKNKQSWNTQEFQKSEYMLSKQKSGQKKS